MSVAEKFGRNLFMARRRAGLSEEELAIRAELHRSEVGLLEKGRRTPRIDTVARLAGALEAESADLLRGIAWQPGDPPRGMGRGRYAWAMAKRSKMPADLNRLAAAIVGDATDETLREPESPEVRAGRTGGKKGGKVRAERLSPEQRTEAARHAAKARWSQNRP